MLAVAYSQPGGLPGGGVSLQKYGTSCSNICELGAGEAVDLGEDGSSGLAHFNFIYHNLNYSPQALAGEIPTGG